MCIAIKRRAVFFLRRVSQWAWTSGMGERGMGKVPGEIVGGLISHIEGVY